MKNVFCLLVIGLLLSSCTNIKSVESKKEDVSSINFFTGQAPKKGENRVYPMALTSGYLVLKNNCIYLAAKKDSEDNLRIVLWPWNYSLKSSPTGIHVMDGNNQVAGKVGGFVKLGGAGGSFKNSTRKPNPRYHACMAQNVVGAWAASPNFKRPLTSSPSETTRILRER